MTLDNAREPKSFASGTAHQITFLMGIYGLVASVLPVWLVLEPRDYLSTYVKLGTITVLIVGVFVVHPNIKFPNFTPFIHGGGPIIKGNLSPFLFVIAVQSRAFTRSSLAAPRPQCWTKKPTPASSDNDAMIAESLVGVLALIAACSLYPGDYFAITPRRRFSATWA